MTVPDAEELGRRLDAQGSWLRLLLHHLAGRHVRAAVDVDDLVQETWLRILSSSDRSRLPAPADGEAAFRRYLATVGRHCVVDVARALRAAKREGRRRQLDRSTWSHAGSLDDLTGAGPGPATLAGMADEQRRLAAAFDRLSPEHRRVLGLRQIEGRSARDAARRLGRSESAVHSLYRRALQAWEAEVARGQTTGGRSAP